MSVLREVADERDRQDDKWGEQNHDLPMWTAILGEEFGEFSREALEWQVAQRPDGAWLAIHHMMRAREEAIQTAAVAVAIAEYIDRYLSRNELAKENR